MAYPLGTEVQLTGEFTNSSGIATDPTTVTLYYLPPGQVTPTQVTNSSGLTRTSTGVYAYDIYLDTPGTWTYCWKGTGACQTATFDIPIVVQSSTLRTN